MPLPARRLTPSWTTAARQQMALLFRSGRVWILLAASVAPVLFIEAMRLRSVARAGYEDLYSQIPSVVLAFRFFMYVAPAWGLLVWYGEAWDERRYHWSLPVPQPLHDLLRVGAGAAWLLVGSALCAGTGLVLALEAGQTVVLELGPVFWLNFVTYPLTFFLLGTLFPLVTGKPLAWAVGCAGVAALVFLAGQWFGIGPITGAVDAILDGRFGLYRAIEGGLVVQTIEAGAGEPVTQGVYTATPAEWLAAMTLWLGVPLVAVVLGAHRRR